MAIRRCGSVTECDVCGMCSEHCIHVPQAPRAWVASEDRDQCAQLYRHKKGGGVEPMGRSDTKVYE